MRLLSLAGVVTVLALVCAVPTPAQKVVLFGGYSFVHAPVTFDQQPGTPTTPKVSLHGWEASGSLRFFGPLSLKADLGGTEGSFQGANTRLNTYLFGPQLRLPFGLFGHALIGAAHQSIRAGVSNGVVTSGPTQTDFATALGGGLDLHVLPFISLRVIQADYLYTHFNSTKHNQPRISAGVVLHF
jgi:hypothetical protein